MQISKKILEPERFIRRAKKLKETDTIKFHDVPKLSDQSYAIMDFVLKRAMERGENREVRCELSELIEHLKKTFDEQFDENNTLIYIKAISCERFDVSINGWGSTQNIGQKSNIFNKGQVDILLCDAVYEQFNLYCKEQEDER